MTRPEQVRDRADPIATPGAKLRKVSAYVRLYGVPRTVQKVVGRTRMPLSLVRRSRVDPDMAMIGCGQFGFATIGYFIARRFGARFRWCYDIDDGQRNSFARFFRVRNVADAPDAWNADPALKYVYIASNHASHADYAIASLAAGKTVYVEKPVAVSFDQLAALESARRQSGGRIFAGYNRPFSAAIRALRGEIGADAESPLSLSCFVSGHQIARDHWYRDPGEGTRICGNAGHWIDLFMHMCHWRRTLPESCRLAIAWADDDEPDDNFTLSVTTDRGDLFALTLSSRSEPFEGINESINVQQGATIAKIDDFRRMTVWRGDRRRHFRFWPKDVGHRAAIMQPFDARASRAWEEVLRSSVLTLNFADMVRSGVRERTVDLRRAFERVAPPETANGKR